MAASASDIRDALSLPAASTSTTPAPSKKFPGGARKPEGVSRELFSLIGDAAPSLVPALARPRFKARPAMGKARVRWELREFKHPTRDDGFALQHWEKVSGKREEPKEYPFAKFSRPSTVLEYTDQEYAEWIQGLDHGEWTREETDYLMKLVKEYDARFYVIHDRYEFLNGVTRTIEDLKHRYYGICRKLLRHRPAAELGDISEATRQELVQAYSYDRDRELTRKNYVAGLLARTPEQIAEEEMLFLLCKRLEQTERRFAREREDLLRNLAGIDSGLPNLPVDDEPFTALGALPAQSGGAPSASNKRKRKSEAADLDSPSGTPPVAKKINMARHAVAVDDEKHCIIRTDGGSLTVPTTKAAHHPVFLRSSRIPQPKSTNATKIQAALVELGINFTKLVMPTRDTLANLETLFEAAGQLVEAKRALDKIEHEIRVLKAKKGEEDEAEAAVAE
ncbi:hypothetical protein EXIGLDRAFT_629969 [Exidia glandulosa HHB12029]|uniref:SWR1-complex protein 4 n=1 Tax=Exidia glandulosa HHB12029 TaxID=1314781 RepID=A0A165BFT1_EXIGL|nr:hypothetical protein EXIGLDRAFT_629969 [Exidia glandulosa HHB12029]